VDGKLWTIQYIAYDPPETPALDEFRQQPAPVDLEEIVRQLADVQIESDSTLAA
jgi:hypothetical protein